MRISRRSALRLGLGMAAAGGVGFPVRARTEAPEGESSGSAFSFDRLSKSVRRKARRPFAEEIEPLPDLLSNLSYDEHRAIRFRPEHALWQADPVEFQLQAFHPGFLLKETIRLHVVEDGKVRRVSFDAGDFEYRPPLDPSLFQEIEFPGIAGFRLHNPLNRPDYFDELITFLGASYFRAVAEGSVYGLSARGLAINTATETGEEFPRFTDFYVVRPQPGERTIRVMAELHSPSLAGAYLFDITPGPETVVDVTTRLYLRERIERLGIAPLTSMFAFGENDEADYDDFRPEVHDSDGLVIHSRDGNCIWRPLQNPAMLAQSFFEEDSPKAFGLVQRDRTFSHYEDIEADYHRRPSLLIEPQGEWGRGTVQLIEIPTASEANDNIVAFWVPDARMEAGSAHEYRYRMRWSSLPGKPAAYAIVTGTFTGVGGNAVAEEPTDTRRFSVDFSGGPVSRLAGGEGLAPLVDISENGKILHAALGRLPDGGWRMSLEAERSGPGPIELRGKLSYAQQIVSETWMCQWTDE